MKSIKTLSAKLIALSVAVILITSSMVQPATTAATTWEEQLNPDSATLLGQLKPVVQQVNPELTQQNDFTSETAQKFISDVRGFEIAARDIELEKIDNPEAKPIFFTDVEILKNLEQYVIEFHNSWIENFKKRGLNERIKAREEIVARFKESCNGENKQKFLDEYFEDGMNQTSLRMYLKEKLPTFYHVDFGWAPRDVELDLANKFNNDFLIKYNVTQNLLPKVILSIKIPSKSDRNNPMYLKEIAKRSLITQKCTQLIKTLAENQSGSLNINFYNSKIKKLFPQISDPDKTFTKKHLNSAENGFMLLNVFREEECLKTIIHETNHFILLDAIAPKITSEMFAIDKIINTNEILVEGLATILNIIITAQEISGDNTELFNQYFKEMWANEKTFELLQTAKILYLSGFKSFEVFLNPSSTEKRVKQTSAAAEYHILKAALVLNPDELLKIIVQQGDKPELEFYAKNSELMAKKATSKIKNDEYSKLSSESYTITDTECKEYKDLSIKMDALGKQCNDLYAEIETIEPQIEEDQLQIDATQKSIQKQLQELLLHNCNNPEFKQKIDAFISWFSANNPENELAKTGRMTLIEKQF